MAVYIPLFISFTSLFFMHPLERNNRKVYAERFDERYEPVWHDRIEKISKLLEGKRGKLLDIGCGDGSVTQKIVSRSYLIPYGVELVPRNVLKARNRGIKAKKCNLLQEKIPFREKFDVVFAGEILEHLIETEKLVRKMKALTKSNGTIIISIPNTAAWYNRFLLFFGFLPFWIESGSEKSFGTLYGKVNGHVRAFTKKSLVEILEYSGLRVERLLGAAIDPRAEFGNRLKARLSWSADKFFSRFPSLSTSIIAVCKKP